jgi:hypothetical protein
MSGNEELQTSFKTQGSGMSLTIGIPGRPATSRDKANCEMGCWPDSDSAPEPDPAASRLRESG